MVLDVEFDHVGFIVNDLAAGANAWRALGFELSPISPQMGLNATGEFEPWATANQCAVFENGYLELIGIHRPEYFNPWERFLQRGDGAHIAAFRCDVADETYARLAELSADFQPPVQRRRDAPYWDEGKWTSREMRFRNIFSRDEQCREARYIIIEHQTPEVLWQPHLTTQPNAVTSLVSMSFVAADEPVHERLALLGNAQANCFRCTRGGHVELLTPKTWQTRFPGCGEPRLDAISSCTVATDNLAALRARLDKNAVQYYHDADEQRLWIAPAFANGTVIEFIPSI